MKKIMSMLGVAGLAVASFAAVNDTVINFSTPGPDVYGDGTPVLPRECYALVWSADGNFEGIKADGTPVDPKDAVVLVADVAVQEDGVGHCPNLFYIVPAADAENWKDGVYAVYLLDTRVVAVDGTKTVGGLDAQGKLKAVNTLVAVSDDMSVAAGAGATAVATAKSNVKYSADCYAAVESPTITGITVNDAKITITASGLSDVAKYWVVKGSELGKGKEFTTVGELDAEGKCTFDKPDEPFFKVIGGYKVEIK